MERARKMREPLECLLARFPLGLLAAIKQVCQGRADSHNDANNNPRRGVGRDGGLFAEVDARLGMAFIVLPATQRMADGVSEACRKRVDRRCNRVPSRRWYPCHDCYANSFIFCRD